ncbi:MAG: DUF4838 domain-containing protein [Planctomycetes bacterium]|nr:DUF4838 domain-containing protein [Planctomycetota bacterium]
MRSTRRPRRVRDLILTLCVVLAGVCTQAHAAPAKHASPADTATQTLVAGEGEGAVTIVGAENLNAIIIVAPDAGKNERMAADDLAVYIEKMTGAKLTIADTDATIKESLASKNPLLILGKQALKLRPDLAGKLDKAVKQNPTLRADGIILQRDGRKIYIAGSNDDSHYYAVARLLQLWGCRWYLPTEIGECIPTAQVLKIGKIDQVYGSPFEVRGYWISWNGGGQGAAEFQLRNFMNHESVPSGHSLSTYVGDMIPPGKSAMNVPISDPKTAQHVADKVAKKFASGENFSMGMEDGSYTSDYAPDKELQAGLRDKYFHVQVLTDPFMVFYNQLCEILLKQSPDSKSKIGFLAYSNITVPPQRNIVAAKPLVAYLAPIDTDPTHGMDDPRSPMRAEYRDMMYRWSQVMQGRVVIYDYDQGMLVWRDVPNPSHMAFRQDVKHYRKAGILGVSTESRNAIATTFLNLHVRGQLLWNPDADVDAMLREFYPRFYGPAAEPMEKYWTAIYKAWDETIATEHEFFVAPVVYTPELVEELRKNLNEANALVKPIEGKKEPTRGEELILQRMRFTRLSFGIIDNYTKAVHAATAECDYKSAVVAGEAGLKIRDELTDWSPIFTTYRGMNGGKREAGDCWYPGEIDLYAEMGKLTDGTKGKLVKTLPLEWSFHRDPNDAGVPYAWAAKKADLAYWNANKSKFPTPGSRKEYPTTEWETIRTDLYPQAQGVLHPDWQNMQGFLWYKTGVKLDSSEAAGNVHVMFPGAFSEAWIYVNGSLVAHREANHIWWYADYKFIWDVGLTGQLKAGENDITIRFENTHHIAGLFRRPFLYRPN